MQRGGAKQMRQQQFGKYLLLDRIAVGGMAEIFLARQMGPFAHRDAAFAMNIVGTWPDPTENELHTRWVREFAGRLLRHELPVNDARTVARCDGR